MPKPFAICIENLNARSGAPRYLRCVALPGRQSGLRLDGGGRVLWQQDDVVACELWVSADDRLMLYRQEGMAPVTLQRSGRSLDVPCSKPVVLADQDQIRIGRRRLRVHIHGVAAAVSAPSPFPVSPGALHRLARAATTAAVVGGVVLAAGCAKATPTIVPTPTIEVREMPPATEPPIVTPLVESIQGEWIVAQVYDMGGEQTWITGTLTIVGDAYTFKPARQVTGPSVEGVLDFLFAQTTGEIDCEGRANSCVFLTNGKVIGQFWINEWDAPNLKFFLPDNQSDLWSVTKQVEE